MDGTGKKKKKKKKKGTRFTPHSHTLKSIPTTVDLYTPLLIVIWYKKNFSLELKSPQPITPNGLFSVSNIPR